MLPRQLVCLLLALTPDSRSDALRSVIFIAASIGCALAPSIEALIALRVVQSMGASAVLSLGAGSLADLFDTHERGEKMGMCVVDTRIQRSLTPAASTARPSSPNPRPRWSAAV
jgi:MFS family permease